MAGAHALNSRTVNFQEFIGNGRVYRYDIESERLDLLLDTGQSPNGLVMNEREDVLYVAMTRGNSVWRLPIMPGGDVGDSLQPRIGEQLGIPVVNMSVDHLLRHTASLS